MVEMGGMGWRLGVPMCKVATDRWGTKGQWVSELDWFVLVDEWLSTHKNGAKEFRGRGGHLFLVVGLRRDRRGWCWW